MFISAKVCQYTCSDFCFCQYFIYYYHMMKAIDYLLYHPILLEHHSEGLFADILEVRRPHNIALPHMVESLHFAIRWTQWH